MGRYFLGIDTSVYTTSVAAMDGTGRLLIDKRKLLTVPAGKRGLRQSEGVFQHISNLPVLLDGLSQVTSSLSLGAIVFSDKPRPVEDSYLPVFRVGMSIAKSISGVNDVPVVASTHQEGHLFAGVWSNSLLRRRIEEKLNARENSNLLAVHFSGGTSELIHLKLSTKGVVELDLIGSTSDLHAGQFVDRIGVMLGLPFPSGPYLERLAASCSQTSLRLPVAVKGAQISFSGPTTAAMRAISQGVPPAEVAKSVLECVSQTLIKWLINAAKHTGVTQVLLVGGVMSNQYIRQRLQSVLVPDGFQLFFAEPKYSTDNAAGLAYYGYWLSQIGQL